MDPWVRTQIRLAERQGLLTGRGLSALQALATHVRVIEDLQDEKSQREDEFKVALLASRYMTYDQLFPTVETDDEAPLADVEDEVIYKFTDAKFDPGEADALLAELLGEVQADGGRMVVPGADIVGA